MSTDEATLAVRCPRLDCAKPAGKPCLYLTAPAGSGREIGQPIPSGHAERRKLGRQVRERKQEVDQAVRAHEQELARKQARVLLSLVIPAYQPAVLREYDMGEYRAMRAWLLEHGPLLWQDA